MAKVDYDAVAAEIVTQVVEKAMPVIVVAVLGVMAEALLDLRRDLERELQGGGT